MKQAAPWPPNYSPELLRSSTLLFRYSAVTFNGHRIHYDWPYATEQEGNPGLLVHGPLIATLALEAFVRANPDTCVRRFSFKGVRPLISPAPFNITGLIEEEGIAKVWVGSEAGVGQEGVVEFE